MTIRTKLRLITMATMTIAVVFIGSVFIFLAVLGHAYGKQRIAEKIAESAFQSNMLRTEYRRFPSERPKAQWAHVHETQTRLLEENASLFVFGREKELFDEIRIISVQSTDLFGELVRNIEQGGSETIVQELSNQLSLKAQTKISDALQLTELSRQGAAGAGRFFVWAVLVLEMFLIGIVITSSAIGANIMRSIRALEKNFTSIADLDFSSVTAVTGIATGGSGDEIGRLARAFNTMVEKLKESYVGLEAKIKVRTAQLGEDKAKNEAILASIGDGVVVADKEGRITYVNQAFEEMVGWKTQDVLGKYIVEVVPREDEKGETVLFKERILTQVLAGKIVIADLTTPFYYIRKDKSRFPASSIVTPIVFKGQIIGIVETFRNITKEKGIDKAKSEFISLASHQLRTPLSEIRWALSILRRSDIGAKEKKLVTTAHTASAHMAETISAMLRISEIETGRVSPRHGAVPFRALLEEVIRLHEVEIARQDIRVTLECDPTLYVRTDEQLLKEVLTSLLGNACKYSPKGGSVAIRVHESQGSVRVEVADTGFGIPKHEQQHVSEKFFRASNIVDKQVEGSGIGLYIVYSLVKLLKGTISFVSDEQKGTTFMLSFPSSAA